MSRIGIAAAIVLIGLTGCSAPEAAPTVTTTATVTVTATATVEAAPSPSPSASPSPGVLAIGETLTLNTLTLTVTGLTADSEFAGDPVRAWQVKACNTGTEDANFSSAAWFAVTNEGGRITAGSISGDTVLEPAYPAGGEAETKGRTAPGECLTGLIPFLPGNDIIELRYENYLGERGTWGVGS